MLARAVQSYLAVRRAAGFSLRDVGIHLKSFAAYTDAQGQHYVNSQTAIEWARQVPSVQSRARRLADVARFARYLQRKMHVTRYRPRSSAASGGPDRLLTSSPRNRSVKSFAWLRSRVTALCAGRPTVRFSRCCPVRDFVSLRPSG
jgi:hypothetical protein